MRIVKLDIRQVGNCPDLFRRRLDTADYNSNHIQNILDERSNGGTDLSGGIFDGIGYKILRPSASPECSVSLPNGCDTGRYIFTMKVEISKNNIRSKYKILKGYVDRPDCIIDGPSGRPIIDPDTRFYFDTMLDVSYTNAMHHGERVLDYKSSGRLQFLNRTSKSDFTASPDGLYANSTYRITPSDIISRYKNDRPSRLSNERIRNYASEDLRHINNTGAMMKAIDITESKNAIPANFIDNVVNAIDLGYTARQNRRIPDDHEEGFDIALFGEDSFSFDETSLSEAKLRAQKHTLAVDRFFNDLAKNGRIYDVGYLHYDEIESYIRRNEDDPFRIVEVFLAERGEHINRRGESCDLDFGNSETIIANIIAIAIPSILNDNDYKYCELTANNFSPDGRFTTFIKTLHTVTGDADSRINYNRFVTDLECKVLDGICLNSEQEVEVSIKCHINNDCFISVSVDGGYMEEYIFPVYCSGVYSPNLTENEGVINRVSEDLVGLAMGLSPIARRRSGGGIVDSQGYPIHEHRGNRRDSDHRDDRYNRDDRNDDRRSYNRNDEDDYGDY